MPAFSCVIVAQISADNGSNQNRDSPSFLGWLYAFFKQIVLEGADYGRRTAGIGIASQLRAFIVVAEANHQVVAGFYILQDRLVLICICISFRAGAGNSHILDVDTLDVESQLCAPAGPGE